MSVPGFLAAVAIALLLASVIAGVLHGVAVTLANMGV